ncbi:MAG TPA: hypothetical protein VI758_11190, partial [Bacteroidota bacterium]
MNTTLKFAASAAVLIAVLSGCADEGKTPTKAPVFIGGLTVGFDTVYSFPQDTIVLALTGGIPPYAVAPPNGGAAHCRVTDSTLTIVTTSVGSTIARITD